MSRYNQRSQISNNAADVLFQDIFSMWQSLHGTVYLYRRLSLKGTMPQPVDTLNLGFLSEYEHELILEVLQRDEELRQAEEKRVRSEEPMVLLTTWSHFIHMCHFDENEDFCFRKLKTELLDVKRKGAKRGSGKYSLRSCARCQEPLSRLTIFSSQCKICNHNVCQNCRTVIPGGSWLCSVCAKES